MDTGLVLSKSAYLFRTCPLAVGRRYSLPSRCLGRLPCARLPCAHENAQQFLVFNCDASHAILAPIPQGVVELLHVRGSELAIVMERLLLPLVTTRDWSAARVLTDAAQQKYNDLPSDEVLRLLSSCVAALDVLTMPRNGGEQSGQIEDEDGDTAQQELGECISKIVQGIGMLPLLQLVAQHRNAAVHLGNTMLRIVSTTIDSIAAHVCTSS